MTYVAVENTPISVNLVTEAQDTGWSINGSIATHSSVNSGYITLTSYPVVAGHTYNISYTILTGGGVQTYVGGTAGTNHASPTIVVETITAGANGYVKLYSSTNVTVQLFNIKDVTVADGVTIVYDAVGKKWSYFMTMYPDFGLSIFESTVLASGGNLYSQQNGSSTSINNFFGTQYQSIIQFCANSQPTLVKKFKSITIQSNQLFVTQSNGITTSLGQVSELIQQDFLKGTLSSGAGSVSLYTNEGIYSAQFWRDKNTGLINGDPLKGNWIQVALVTFDGSIPFQLFSVAINDKQSKIGVR